MKTVSILIPLGVQLPAILFTFLVLNVPAATRYVWQDSPSPAPPYTNWATAAHIIQDAVDASAPGDQVLVTNGVYATGGRAVYHIMTNRVAIDRAISVQSVSGPEVTIIEGWQVPGSKIGEGAIRCIYLTNGASLSGFTLKDGATRNGAFDFTRGSTGGGVLCESTNAMVSNCIFRGNAADAGGGASFGTLNNCTLSGNWANLEGGGAYESTLNKCTFVSNSVSSFGSGGGAYNARLNHCIVKGNSAGLGGGVASDSTYSSSLNFCTLANNSAFESGGGAYGSTLNDCTLKGNSAPTGGGASGISTLNNCVLTGNSATSEGGGTYGSTLYNCIVFFNTAANGANYYQDDLYYCCTTPPPTSGVGNITNAPLFLNMNGWSNLRLQSNSPCINAGNNDYVTNSTDLDGRPRSVGGTVDMGAYEFQGPGLSEFIGWLAQYDLPTDGSDDFADADLDGHNAWQEWKAWTVPTNALSVLKLLPPQPGMNGTPLTWQSVSGQSYLLERATNAGGSFSLLQSNLAGQADLTSFTDTNTAGGSAFFYRVGVPH